MQNQLQSALKENQEMKQEVSDLKLDLQSEVKGREQAEQETKGYKEKCKKLED